MPSLTATGYQKGDFWKAREYIDTYATAASTITSTGTLDLWTPTSGTKFRLKRLIVDVTVTTTLNTNAVVYLQAIDSNVAIANLTAFAINTAAGANRHIEINLGAGKLSAAANNVLKLGISATINAGVVGLAGVAMGTEE